MMLGLIAWLSALFAPHAVVAKLIMHDDSGRTFEIEISEPENIEISSRNLRISCISGCIKELEYRESIDDVPLGIFRLSDGNDVIYITSVSGSAYQIRAYYFDQSQIRNVLNQASSSAPAIVISNNRETVQVYLRDYSRPGVQYAPREFEWRDEEFVEASR